MPDKLHIKNEALLMDVFSRVEQLEMKIDYLICMLKEIHAERLNQIKKQKESKLDFEKLFT